MRFCIAISVIFYFASCAWKAYSDDKYIFDKDLRALIDCYKIGDTLVFRSSNNSIDSFVISKIDSSLNNNNGFFINARNYKSITVFYKQIPIDKWQRHRIEMGPNNNQKKEIAEDGTLITIEKFPDDGTSSFSFNFKEARCYMSDVPKYHKDTVRLGSYTFSNYYKIHCDDLHRPSEMLQVYYSKSDKGLVAFTGKGGEIWIRQK